MKRSKLEVALLEHGEDRATVADLAAQHGQTETARRLSEKFGIKIEQQEVNRYLKEHYQRVVTVKYIPIGKGESA